MLCAPSAVTTKGASERGSSAVASSAASADPALAEQRATMAAKARGVRRSEGDVCIEEEEFFGAREAGGISCPAPSGAGHDDESEIKRDGDEERTRGADGEVSGSGISA